MSKYPVSHEISREVNAFGPQHVGLFIEADREQALQDPDTVIVANFEGNPISVLTPVANNSEANQAFFSGEGQAFFFNASELDTSMDLTRVAEKIATLPEGTVIALEQIGDDVAPTELLTALAIMAGKTLVLDQKALDELNGTLAAVHHFYSPINYEHRTDVTFETMRDAYKWLEANGLWEPFTDQGIGFVNGADMTDELMEQLWDVYDQTFDVLISNHPSAQKQPKEDFFHQCQAPESNITYAIFEGEICSALFVVDNVEECYWLNSEYFKSVNPDGATLFVPGISTKINKQGMSLSPRIIDAMAYVIRYVPSITGFATQCTNRSADYIPGIAENSTADSARLNFTETKKYTYPVYTVANENE